jgi:hypothetical protein
VSTYNKIDARAKRARDQRRTALKFFREQTKLPGAPGVIARILYVALSKVQKDPALSGPEKEAAFRAVLQRAKVKLPE